MVGLNHTCSLSNVKSMVELDDDMQLQISQRLPHVVAKDLQSKCWEDSVLDKGGVLAADHCFGIVTNELGERVGSASFAPVFFALNQQAVSQLEPCLGRVVYRNCPISLSSTVLYASPRITSPPLCRSVCSGVTLHHELVAKHMRLWCMSSHLAIRHALSRDIHEF